MDLHSVLNVSQGQSSQFIVYNISTSPSTIKASTITGNTLYYYSPGTYTIGIYQPGDNNYNDTATQSATIIITKADQTDFNVANTAVTQEYTEQGELDLYSVLNVSQGQSSQSIVYTISTSPSTSPTPPTITGNTLYYYSPGTYTIGIYQPGDNNYNDTATQSATIIITKADQTDFNVANTAVTQEYTEQGELDLYSVLNVSQGQSSQSIVYTISTSPSTTPTTPTITGNTLYYYSPGTYTIGIYQPGDNNYNDTATQSATIIITKADQTDFNVANTAVTQEYTEQGELDLYSVLNVSQGQSSQSIVYTISTSPSTSPTPPTITGNTLYYYSPGTYTIGIYQPGDNNYNDTATQSATIRFYFIIENTFILQGSTPNTSYGGKGSVLNFAIRSPHPYKVYWNTFFTSHDVSGHKGGSAVYLGYVPFDELVKEDLNHSNIIAIAGGGGGYGEENFPLFDEDDSEIEPTIRQSHGGNAGISNEDTYTRSYNGVTYDIYSGQPGITAPGYTYTNSSLVETFVSGGGEGGTHQEVSGHHIMDGVTLASELELFYYGQGEDGQFLYGGRGNTYEPYDDYKIEPDDVSRNQLYSRGGTGGSGFFGGGAGMSVYRIQSGGGGGSSIINRTEVTNISSSYYNNSDVTKIIINGTEITTVSGSFEIINQEHMYSISYEHSEDFSTNTLNLSNISSTPQGFQPLSQYRIHYVRNLVVPESDASYVIHNNTELSYNSIGTYVVYGISGDEQMTNRSTITINKAVQPTPISFINTSFDFSATLPTVQLEVSGGWSNDATVSFEIIGESYGSYITDNSFTYVNTGSYNIKATRDGSYNYFDISKSEIITIQPGQQGLYFGSIFSGEQPPVTYNEDSKEVNIKTSYLNQIDTEDGKYDISFSFSSEGGDINNDGLFRYTDVSSYPITVTRHISNFADLSGVLDLSITKADQPTISFINTSFDFSATLLTVQLEVTGGWSNDATVSFEIIGESYGSYITDNSFTYVNTGSYNIKATRDGSYNYFDISKSEIITIQPGQQGLYFGSIFSREQPPVTYNENSNEVDIKTSYLNQIETEYDISFSFSSEGGDINNDGLFRYTDVSSYPITVTRHVSNFADLSSVLDLSITKAVQPTISFINTSFDFSATLPTVQLEVSGGWSNDATVSFEIIGEPSGSYITDNSFNYVNIGSYNIKATRDGGYNYFDISKSETITIQPGEQELHFQSLFSEVQLPPTYKEDSKEVDIKTYLNDIVTEYDISFSFSSEGGDIDSDGLFTYKDVSSYPITVTRHVANFADLSGVLDLSITKAEQPDLRFTSTSFNYNRDTKSIDLTKFITGGWSNDAVLSFSIVHNGSVQSVFTSPTPYQYNDLSGHFNITVTRIGGQNYIDKVLSSTIIISDFSVQNKDISYNPDNRTLDLSSTLLLDIGYLTEYDISFTVISAKYLHETDTAIDPSTYSITDFSFSYIYAGEYDISTTELYHPLNNVQSISAKLKIERIPQRFEIKNEDISYSKTNTYDLIQLITEQDDTSSEPVHYTIKDTEQNVIEQGNNSILQYASKGVYNINISREGNQNYLDASKNSILSIDKSDLPVPVTFTIGGGTPDGSTSEKGASLSFTVDIIEDVLFYWDISNGGNDNGGGSAVFVGYTVPGSNMDISNILCIVGGGGKGSENGFGGTAGYELIDISSTVDGTRFAVYNGHPGTTNRGNVVASGGNMTDQTFFTDSSSLGGNGYRTGETSNSGGGGGGSTFVNLSKISSYSIGVNDSPIPFLNIKVNNIDDEELDVSGNQSDVKEIRWTPIRFTKPSYDFSYNDVVDLETFIVKYTNYGVLSDVSYLDTQVFNTELALSETSILTNANGDNPDVSIDGDNYDQYVVHAKFIDPNDNYNTYSIDASLQIHKAVQPSMEFIDITDVSYDYPSKTLSGTVSGGWSTVADMSYEIMATYFDSNYDEHVTFQTPVIFTGANVFDLSYGNAGTYKIIATKDGSRNYVDSSINTIVTVDKNALAIGPDVSFVNISFQYNDPFYNLNFDLSQTQFFGKHEKITKDVSYNIQSQPNVPQNAEINNNTDFSYQYVGQYIIMAGIFDDPNYQDISTTFTIDILKSKSTPFSFYNTDTNDKITRSTHSEYTKESKSLSFTVSGGWSQESDISCEIQYTHHTDITISNEVQRSDITIINPSDVQFNYTNAGNYDILVTRDGSWNFLDISTVHRHIVNRISQDLSFNDLSFSYNETPYHLQFDLSAQAIDYYQHDSNTNVSYEIITQPNGIPVNAQIVDYSKFSYHYIGDYILKASVEDAINYFDVSTTFSIGISKAYQTRDFSFVFQSFTIENSELLVTDETDVSTVYNPLDKIIDFTVSGGWSQNADISCEIQYTHHTDITISNEVHDINIIDSSDVVQFNYTNAGNYEISVTRDGSWNYFDLTISTEFVVNRAVQELSFNDISFSYNYNDTLIYDLSQGIDHEEPHCDGNIMYSIETQPTVPTNAIVRVNTSIFDYSYAGVYEILAEKDGSTNYYDISDTFLIEIEKANQLSHFPELSFNNTFETEISYNPIDKDVSFTVQGGFPIGDLTCEIRYNNNSDVFVENVSQSNILIKSSTDVSFAYINTGFYDVTITRDGSWNYHDLSISETVQIQKYIKNSLSIWILDIFITTLIKKSHC